MAKEILAVRWNSADVFPVFGGLRKTGDPSRYRPGLELTGRTETTSSAWTWRPWTRRLRTR